MKSSIIFLFTLFLWSSENSFSQNNSLTSYKIYFDNELKSWTLSLKNFQLPKFKISDTIKFENFPFADTTNLKGFYELYKPALTFSNDSSQFIDIYSFWLNLEKKGNKIIYSGGEVDQAISLCSIRVNKWTRILFCGYSERIQEIIWVTNTKFIMVGIIENEKVKPKPIIYIGNTTRNSFEIFTSIDETCYQNEKGYDSPKLDKINIQKE